MRSDVQWALWFIFVAFILVICLVLHWTMYI